MVICGLFYLRFDVCAFSILFMLSCHLLVHSLSPRVFSRIHNIQYHRFSNFRHIIGDFFDKEFFGHWVAASASFFSLLVVSVDISFSSRYSSKHRRFLQGMSVAMTADRRTVRETSYESNRKDLQSSFDHGHAFQEQQMQQMIQLRDRDEHFLKQAAGNFRNSNVDSYFSNDESREVAGSVGSADTSPIMSLLMRNQSEATSIIPSHPESLIIDKEGASAPVPISPTADKTSKYSPEAQFSSFYTKPLAPKSSSESQRYESRKSSTESLEKLNPDVEYEQSEVVFDLDL